MVVSWQQTLVPEAHLLQQGGAKYFAILGAVAALGLHLLLSLRLPLHVFLVALFTFGTGGHGLKNPDQIKVGLALTRVDIPKDHVIFEPILRFGELPVLLPLAGQPASSRISGHRHP